MKRNPPFLQQLPLACRLGQFYIGIFLLSSFLAFSYATPLVESKEGKVAFVVGQNFPQIYLSKEGGLSFFQSLPMMGLGMLWFAEQTPVLSFEGFGNVSMGPLRFTTGERLHLQMKNMAGEAVQIDSLNGMVSFIRPASPAEIIDAVRFPFLVSVVCFSGINGAILEMLHRMLKKVQQGDAFSPSSVREVRVIGLLFAASGILQPVVTGWLKRSIADYAMQHLSTGIFFDTRSMFNYPLIFTGAVILVLAEILRQGLILKEENTLTI